MDPVTELVLDLVWAVYLEMDCLRLGFFEPGVVCLDFRPLGLLVMDKDPEFLT